MSYERSNIRAMSGYSAGEQTNEKNTLKLNTNENPYPPSQAIKDALSLFPVDDLRRYPSPTAENFRQVAAQYHGVAAENIMVTNGGDELLRLAITTFVEPHQAIGLSDPSYSLYPVLAEINDCPIVQVALSENWQLAEDFAQQMNQAEVKLCFIVNPHAPSGTLTKASCLAQIAEEFNGVVLIDEAYVDFIDPDLQYDAVPLIKKFDNVLILRTLSKGYSLAGLRFGYGLGAKSLIEPMLNKTRDSYNTNAISQALATAAIANYQQAQPSWAKIRSERQRVAQQLGKLGFNCQPSQSNFILAQIPHGAAQGQNAAYLYQELKQQNILVRYFKQPRLEDKLRISIGTAEENEKLLGALKGLLEGRG